MVGQCSLGQVRIRLAVTAGLALALGGCFQLPPPQVHEEERGLLYVFPGLMTGTWCFDNVYKGLRDGGVDVALRIEDWDGPGYDLFGPIWNQVHNKEHAARVAAEIAKYHQRRPASPIDLLGYSAGGGMAILVAEALPADVHVRRIVLVQPALSPGYDLTGVLRKVGDRLINLYAPYDVVLLGFGTTAIGTVDRVHTPAAGQRGFELELAVREPSLRHKVEQYPWKTEMWRSGHTGLHTGLLGYEWNKRYVAPLLLRETGEGAEKLAADHVVPHGGHGAAQGNGVP